MKVGPLRDQERYDKRIDEMHRERLQEAAAAGAAAVAAAGPGAAAE